MKAKVFGCAVAAMLMVASLHAAQVCTGAPGTYGAVTLSRSGTCSTFGSTIDGLADGAAISTVNTCSFAFSPAVSTSGLSAKMTNVDNAGGLHDEVGFAINGSSYTLVSADINLTLTPPTTPQNLIINGSNQITGSVGAQSATTGAGTIFFTNSAPSTTSTLDFVKTGTGGVVVQVCFDDGGSAPVATSIPTLSEWAMIFMASLMAMFGYTRLRNRRS